MNSVAINISPLSPGENINSRKIIHTDKHKINDLLTCTEHFCNCTGWHLKLKTRYNKYIRNQLQFLPTEVTNKT